MAAKGGKTVYFCQECGNESPKWLGQCPVCGAWNSFVEEVVNKSGGNSGHKRQAARPSHLSEIVSSDEKRISSGMPELDRVLGGGIVRGSLVLVGGDPGIGKSTLLLQVCRNLCQEEVDILYVSGEESLQQIKIRADRMGVFDHHLSLLCETDLEAIRSVIDRTGPQLVVIDSIQTMYRPDIESAPGSVSQVRECAMELMRVAKTAGIAVFVIGHVTKEGSLAGPRVLEHIVDTVLYFEGARNAEYRVLRAVKNRFGSTNELGLFEMRDVGLVDVPDASKLFLSERAMESGSIIVPTVEGTRPLLVEVQALVAPTPYQPPRRTADSVDVKRIQLLLAVLEKRVKLPIGAADVYVKVAGSIRLDEPAADLALSVAMASSFANRLPRPHTVVCGEVGLSGEVRAVSQAELRVAEARRLGFRAAVLPMKNYRQLAGKFTDMQLFGAETIGDALKCAMPKNI